MRGSARAGRDLEESPLTFVDVLNLTLALHPTAVFAAEAGIEPTPTGSPARAVRSLTSTHVLPYVQYDLQAPVCAAVVVNLESQLETGRTFVAVV